MSSYGNCAGCHTKISTKEFLNCYICKSRFDLLCANVSDKRFNLMETSHKQNWRCQGCLVKLPKTDNTNTPIRGTQQEIITEESRGILKCGIAPSDNVTKRKKGTTSTTAPTLTKEDVRELLKEEFILMKQTLVEDLHLKLKGMVKEELLLLKQEISSLEDSVKFMNDEHESIRSDFLKQNEYIRILQNENSQLTNTVHDLSSRLESMEQITRSCNLEIQCIPEHKNENLITTVTQLSKAVSCEIKKDDIHHCTRVAKVNKQDHRPRAVIVKLATPRIRDTLLAGVVKFNKANSNDKLNTSHLGIGGNKQPIYVMEHLSPINRKLHAAARLKSKELGYKFVWIKHGRVFMRKNDASEFIIVKNQSTLDKLI